MIIAPSILSADFANLKEEVATVENAGADWLHLDVMDGHFVPNLTFGVPLITSIRPHSKLFFDAHLMISNPANYIANFANAGADGITVHIEAIKDNPLKTLEAIRMQGKKVGLALKPETLANSIGELFPFIDMILVMTVNPGFGGQKFMGDQLAKIHKIRQWIDASGRDIRLQVDGGIDSKTITEAVAAGANVFVAGNAVFNDNDYSANISKLRNAIAK